MDKETEVTWRIGGGVNGRTIKRGIFCDGACQLG